MDQTLTVTLPTGITQVITSSDLAQIAIDHGKDIAEMYRIALNTKYQSLERADANALYSAKLVQQQQKLQEEKEKQELSLETMRMRTEFMIEERALLLLPNASGYRLRQIDRANRDRGRILRNIKLRGNGDEYV